MADSYTFAATVTDPVHAVWDMTLSLERVTSLLGDVQRLMAREG